MCRPEGKTQVGTVRCVGGKIGHEGIAVDRAYVDSCMPHNVVPYQIVVCRKCGLVLEKGSLK